LPPAAAKDYFETDVFFMILRSKIMKNTSVSNLNLARSAIKDFLLNPILFTHSPPEAVNIVSGSLLFQSK
jgi:hypothetical protein